MLVSNLDLKVIVYLAFIIAKSSLTVVKQFAARFAINDVLFDLHGEKRSRSEER